MLARVVRPRIFGTRGVHTTRQAEESRGLLD
jgi:hypothetical protein